MTRFIVNYDGMSKNFSVDFFQDLYYHQQYESPLKYFEEILKFI
jgi:hypothetical protein